MKTNHQIESFFFFFLILRSSVESWSHKSCEYHGACTLKIDERVPSVFTVGYKKDQIIIISSFNDGGQNGKTRKGNEEESWSESKMEGVGGGTKVFRRYCYFSLLKPPSLSFSLSIFIIQDTTPVVYGYVRFMTSTIHRQL